MTIKTNQELAQAIEKIIDDQGVKKIWISEKMGISNQNFNRFSLTFSKEMDIIKCINASENLFCV